MKELLEELDRIEEAIDGKLVTKYASIISKALLELRAIGGTNPKVGLLIRSIAGDMKKMSSMIKRDLKKGVKHPASHSVPIDIKKARKEMGI